MASSGYLSAANRFTALFASMVIAWLGEAPIKAVADFGGRHLFDQRHR